MTKQQTLGLVSPPPAAMGPLPPPPPPPLFGKYELGRLLGRGSFAKVYHARPVSGGPPVAIKVIDKSSVSDPSAAARVLREVSIMRRLSPHPNIVCLHEVMATRSKIYLVMDYAGGGDLHSRLCRTGRPLPEPVARKYFQQLVSALRFCHSRGVSHRDVKPQNLLLDGAGVLRVSDFGLSALPENAKDGVLRTACGTPAFAAPEVLRRKGYDGARADAWSCGVMLFVLLAGRLPFDDSNLPLLYRKVMKRDFTFPSWVTAPSRRLIWRLLDPNPETRMTVKELAELPWIRRSIISSSPLVNLSSKVEACAVNAFDIISMSSGLDLSGLFEEGRRRMFRSVEGVERVVGRVEEAGVRLGYLVRKGGKSPGSVGLYNREGLAVIAVEVMEVAAAGLRLVEMRVRAEEFGEGMWEELRVGLGDVVCEWYES